MVIRNVTYKSELQIPLISVIVPVYKVEKYLNRCVDSLLNQTYQNIEIILIDDGSPDGSGALCDEYARVDSRVRVVHKENGGLSSARNVGLEIALGSYVTFVDSDDWVSLDIYEQCMAIVQKENCDIVDFQVCYTDGKRITKQIQYPELYESHCGQAILYDYLLRGQTDHTPFSVCRKLYRKDLFDGIRFPVGRINEDLITNFKVLSIANKLTHIGVAGYFYFQNEGTISNGKLNPSYKDIIFVGEELCKLAKQTGNSEIFHLAQLRVARNDFSILSRAVLGGISNEIIEKDTLIKSLTQSLRRNYGMLMKAPMPMGRKAVITAFCIHYNVVSIPVGILKKLKAR